MRVRFPHNWFHGRPLQIVNTETSLCRMAVVVFLNVIGLESKQQQEGHHKTEETHGFWQGETQDGVWEELLLERGVPGVTNNEGTKHCSDTRSWNTTKFTLIFCYNQYQIHNCSNKTTYNKWLQVKLKQSHLSSIFS